MVTVESAVMDCDRSEPLRLVSAITRALGHVLRGELSVIENDVTYFAEKLEPGATERSQRRLSTMVGFLRQLDFLRADFAPRSLTTSELLRCFQCSEQVHGELVAAALDGAGGCQRHHRGEDGADPFKVGGGDRPVVVADRRWIEWMGESIAALAQADRRTWQLVEGAGDGAGWEVPTPGESPRGGAQGPTITVQLVGDAHAAAPDGVAGVTTKYASIERFGARRRGERYVVMGGLADLVLWAHGWSCVVTCQDARAVVRITVPVHTGAVGGLTTRISEG